MATAASLCHREGTVCGIVEDVLSSVRPRRGGRAREGGVKAMSCCAARWSCGARPAQIVGQDIGAGIDHVSVPGLDAVPLRQHCLYSAGRGRCPDGGRPWLVHANVIVGRLSRNQQMTAVFREVAAPARKLVAGPNMTGRMTSEDVFSVVRRSPLFTRKSARRAGRSGAGGFLRPTMRRAALSSAGR